MEIYKSCTFLTWEEVDDLAKSFAKSSDVILDSTTERDGTSMYFLLRFDRNRMGEYLSLFEAFDAEHEFEANDEINDIGWVTIPEEMTLKMVNTIGTFVFQASKMLATQGGVYFLEENQ